MMHGREKSDSAIVAGKLTNKAVSTAAEPVERRAEAKGNASQQSTRRTQSRVSVSQALERIRQAVTKNALPSHTQGGSRMPELGPYGSVRGALSNERPYRDLRNVGANYPFERSHRFAGIQPNSGHRDYSRLSCGVGETQLEPSQDRRRSVVLTPWAACQDPAHLRQLDPQVGSEVLWWISLILMRPGTGRGGNIARFEEAA